MRVRPLMRFYCIIFYVRIKWDYIRVYQISHFGIFRTALGFFDYSNEVLNFTNCDFKLEKTFHFPVILDHFVAPLFCSVNGLLNFQF